MLSEGTEIDPVRDQIWRSSVDLVLAPIPA